MFKVHEILWFACFCTNPIVRKGTQRKENTQERKKDKERKERGQKKKRQKKQKMKNYNCRQKKKK